MNMSSYSCCSPVSTEFKKIDKLSALLKLVGENNRLQILCILGKGAHCVCEIETHIDASQSLISHHLKDLKEGGLVRCEKKGLKVYYSLTQKGKDIKDLLFQILPKEVANK